MSLSEKPMLQKFESKFCFLNARAITHRKHEGQTGQDLVKLRNKKFKNQKICTPLKILILKIMQLKIKSPCPASSKISHISNIKATFFQLNSTL